MELAALDDLIQTAETSPHDRRFTEHTLQQGDGLYVFGKAKELEERGDRQRNAARLIIDGEESRFFALSNMPEEELVDRLGTHVVVKIAGGVLISVLGAAGLLWGAGMLVLPSVL
ncbi:MAG: hypothetical protein SVU32_09640 [Candidatus Nanohaloarchaea archaeon]|nr:hypothetical protein [Candidatus Nanohaloarchaea archaeon]